MTRSSSLSGTVGAQTEKALHVLTLTPFYPTSTDDAQGCFIAEPLREIHKMGVRNSVVAVQPFYRAHAATNEKAYPAKQSRYISLPGGFGLPTAGAFLFASLVSETRRLHRVNPIDVIHAHTALPCGHAAALLSRELHIPFVVSVHGLDAYFTEQVAGHSGRWCKRVSKFVYSSTACVICISEKVRQQVLEGASGQIKTEVVYNGVDTEQFCPCSSDEEAKTILSVGNLIPIKGHELLIRAFAAVHNRFPDFFCEFIGDGPERTYLSALAADLNVGNKVHFLGRRSRLEVAEAMRRCALFALPSRYEGLGCVYLEAMAMGKATIGCRGQGIEEIIEHGANGWLIEPNNQQELADALLELMQNISLRSEIGDAARRTILREFTLAHQAEHLVRIYRECAR